MLFRDSCLAKLVIRTYPKGTISLSPISTQGHVVESNYHGSLWLNMTEYQSKFHKNIAFT